MPPLMLFLFLIVLAHVVAGAMYNKYRLKQLIKHISLCRGKELSERDFLHLLDNYMSFYAPYRFSPNQADYPSLYSNQSFADFAEKSKRIMIYLYSVIIIGFIALAMIEVNP